MRKKQFTFKQLLIRKMPHNLITLLIANKLFEAYIKNTVENYRVRKRHIVDYMELASVVTYEPSDYIQRGFIWSATPEGWHVWHEIYLKILKIEKLQ